MSTGNGYTAERILLLDTEYVRADLLSPAPTVDKWLSRIESACNSALLDVYDLSIANAPVDAVYARGTADCIGDRVGEIKKAVAAIRAESKRH